jgi:outer membrane protein
MGRPARRWLRRAAVSSTLGLSLGLSVAMTADGALAATTLADAIAAAYQSNPTLQAQRAQLRATDETYVQARAGLGPTVQVQSTEFYDHNNVGVVPGLPAGQLGTNTLANELAVSQQLYSGGKSAALVHSAEARIFAGREQLRSTEASVLYQAISAYADVLRDQQSLAVRRQHLDMLVHQLEVAKARQAAGDVTLTDVAQAQAQLWGERALFTTAGAQLDASRVAYATAVGDNPDELAPTPELPNLPRTVDEAFQVAEADNPDLRQALYAEQVSREQVVAARASYRPTVTVTGGAIYSTTSQPFSSFFGPSPSKTWDFNAQATLNVPLFTNGARASVVRQAVEQNASDRIAIEGARRAVVQNVANAWNAMLSARSNTDVEREEVKSADFAFKGMQIEYGAGERSTLDVLLAEQTLRNAQIALIDAQHDTFVAAAALLRVMGRLEARELIASLPAYDPTRHFRQVRARSMVPWTGLMQDLDDLAAPNKRVPQVPVPPLAASPRDVTAQTPIPLDAPMATAVPTAPPPSPAGVR